LITNKIYVNSETMDKEKLHFAFARRLAVANICIMRPVDFDSDECGDYINGFLRSFVRHFANN